MVRADQGIRGRAAPRAKLRSSVTTSLKSKDAGTYAAPPVQHITKAAKRAMKRAELMTQVKNSADQKPSLLNLDKPMSKSSLRRLKRRQKEQLAGNSAGMQDLKDAMEEALDDAGDVDGDEDDDEDPDQGHNDFLDPAMDDEERLYPSAHDSRATAPVLVGGKPAKKGGAVSEKSKKKALSTERQRQNLILSDPAYAKNPFAALRLHAQNTLAFDKGSSTTKKHRNQFQDVDML
ncbi:hypothetical protein BCV70DRAFT_196915 [Testicularia cyperi]|uniref:Ribosome biogenesis protein SLX9 n=1 Tax=Testicularia cyperi TaxID=1882483 RepID=A0A317XY32_9BASI|nr:hypothetical protein BCV70DRAFT_196915 [Testicularia cyperi]